MTRYVTMPGEDVEPPLMHYDTIRAPLMPLMPPMRPRALRPRARCQMLDMMLMPTPTPVGALTLWFIRLIRRRY